MKSKGTIAAIKQSIMDSLARDADVGKNRGYDSEDTYPIKLNSPLIRCSVCEAAW
jgi:hypothetical protein